MKFTLRSYQQAWIDATKRDVALGMKRLLLDAVGGSGKTSYAGAWALEQWEQYEGRTLVLENRQQLVGQTAKRLEQETGLEVDIEMGDHRASPFVPVVVASVASIGRVARLTAFPDSHFSTVIADEAHNSTAELFLRVMQYFHYGAGSLAEEWKKPEDGQYAPIATVVGITATPDNFGKRNLGNFYQKFTARYSYLEAIEDGWLVGVKEVNIPVKIDTRKFHRKATGYGMDFSPEDESAALIPIIEELAEQIVLHAKERKTMCYLPSKDCVMLMSEALNRRGLKTFYVLGDTLDRTEKTDEFYNHPSGICLCLCAMYVEGTDFPTVDTVAWLRATLSPSFYKQGVFRLSRVLPGLVNDSMTADERRAAIAASSKPFGLLISPFFVSDDIDIMGVVDLFVDPSIRNTSRKAPKNFTDAAEIRDYIKALEKAADKHRNKQPRTINPVSFALSLGDKALAAYRPDGLSDASPPSRELLDFILDHGIDTTKVTTSGQANMIVDRLRERKRLGLASPKQLNFLRNLTRQDKDTGRLVPMFTEDALVLIKATVAGAITGRTVGRFNKR